jgi:hypothetical protein
MFFGLQNWRNAFLFIESAQTKPLRASSGVLQAGVLRMPIRVLLRFHPITAVSWWIRAVIVACSGAVLRPVPGASAT